MRARWKATAERIAMEDTEDHLFGMRPRVEIVDVAEFGDQGEPSSSAAGAALPLHQSAAVLKATDFKEFKFPWERAYMGKVFGKFQMPGRSVPSVALGEVNPLSLQLEARDGAAPTAAILEKPPLFAGTIAEQVVKKNDSVDFTQEKKNKRRAAVWQWWELMAPDYMNTAFGRKVNVEATMGNIDEYACQVLDASFAVKSAATLRKGLYALKPFRDWCNDIGAADWIPVTEV
eukprot:Skav216818  [mRNA]  locus=scaffold135:179643:180464:- [translate_table: standard]